MLRLALIGLLGTYAALTGCDLGTLGGDAAKQYTQEYDRCRVAVLVDRKQNQALAFQVTKQQVIVNKTAVRLTLTEDNRLIDHQSQWPPLPFDSVFSEVIVSPWHVYARIRSGNAGLNVIPGERNDEHEVTQQGLTGFVYRLDASRLCQN